MTEPSVRLFPCYICKQRKPAEEFHRNKSRCTKISAGCRLCANAIRRGVPKIAKFQVIPESKQCSDCKQVKLAAEFYHSRVNRNGLTPYCRQCHNARIKVRLRDPEVNRKRKEAIKLYQQTPKHRRYTKERYRKIVADPEQRAALRAKTRAYYARRQAISPQCLRKHGITMAHYSALLLTQKQRCAICQRVPAAKRLGVDHNHATGKIRGLLCGSCNVAIGLLQDNARIIGRAQRYLRQYE